MLRDPIRYVFANWRPLSSLVLLVISIALGAIPPTREFAVPLLSAATASLVLMVWHQEQGPTESPVVYARLQAAMPDIEAALRRELGRARSGAAAPQIRIIGCRLRDMRSVFSAFDAVGLRFESIDFFHIDPEYLESSEPWPVARTDAATVRQSIAELATVTRGAARFHGYRHRPLVYAFLIGDERVFWGFFRFRRDRQTYVGPSTPCLSLSSTDPGFTEIHDWLAALCDEAIEHSASETA